MKEIKIFALSLALAVSFSACTIDGELKEELIAADILEVDQEGNTKVNETVLDQFLDQAGVLELGVEEIAGIKFMLEEEKLARDVYKKLYEKWSQKTFDNISGSEETHIGAVRSLAEKYGINIDFYDDEVGKFTDDKLAGLYNDLVSRGEGSLAEALKVGALIEEIDIVDLEEYSRETSNSDLLLVYENLIRGSRNHLRSFTRTMSRQGQTYEPQRLGQAEYDEIVNSENERGGNGQGGGNQSGKGQGQGRNR